MPQRFVLSGAVLAALVGTGGARASAPADRPVAPAAGVVALNQEPPKQPEPPKAPEPPKVPGPPKKPAPPPPPPDNCPACGLG